MRRTVAGVHELWAHMFAARWATWSLGHLREWKRHSRSSVFILHTFIRPCHGHQLGLHACLLLCLSGPGSSGSLGLHVAVRSHEACPFPDVPHAFSFCAGSAPCQLEREISAALCPAGVFVQCTHCSLFAGFRFPPCQDHVSPCVCRSLNVLDV